MRRGALLAIAAAAIAWFVPAAFAAEPAAAHPGARVYAQHCASCHEGGVPKSPHKMFLQLMATDAIHDALTVGVMQAQAAALSAEQRQAVAEYLTGTPLAEARNRPPLARCTGAAAEFDLRDSPAKAGWGMDGDNSRFIPTDVAGLGAADVPRLQLRWAFAFPQAQRVRSQPLVALGAVYVGSQNGTVYALDAATGCVRWEFRASAEVRTGLVMATWPAGEAPGERPLLHFGDLMARVYAVDARTGELVWSVKADDHPNATVTATPALHDGRLYVAVSSLEVSTAADPKYPCCSFRGSILALDAATGATAWKSYTIPEAPREVGRTRVGTPILAPSGAPSWNTPVVDARRGLLYAGTGENYSSPAGPTSDALLAFRLADGALVWARQKTAGDAWNVACMLPDNPNCPVEDGPDYDFGAATIHARLGERSLLLAGQKSGEVFALDLDRGGEPVWRRKVGRGGIQGGVHFGMALGGDRLFVPISDKDMAARVYEQPARPGLYALDALTGRLLWESPANDVCGGRPFCSPGIGQAITTIPGVVFAGHMDGRLRAYAADTGRVLWETDTTREVSAVNGMRARGGSFGGGAGPVVRRGLLLASSGYGIYEHMAGNVLLAYSVGTPAASTAATAGAATPVGTTSSATAPAAAPGSSAAP
ncbi:MAG: PQQ-binding-like beta-propeller repeat protein [Pseudomonadota bacterium]